MVTFARLCEEEALRLVGLFSTERRSFKVSLTLVWDFDFALLLFESVREDRLSLTTRCI